MIPEDFINEVRESIDIVDLISQYVSLEKKGKDYVGLCPFHQEKTPSFTVNEEKQFFKCFGCGKGGNVFKFLMYKDNFTFPESVLAAANFANIAAPASYQQSQRPMTPEIKIQEAAQDFYHRVLLTTKVGERGLAYARERELSTELIEHFQIGYAPKDGKVLLTYLKTKGYSQAALKASGLFVSSAKGELFDRFRDRLIFPLTNESGYTVAFSGRRINQDKTEAKYLNSPESKIFKKSNLLFHFTEAKKAARTEKHLILYEGYMDVIAAYKAGIHSGIASMGTSLTEQQVYLLKRTTPNIIINYDGDNPGVNAERRAVELFRRARVANLGIVVLPENLDPDEYVKKYGPEKYQEQVKAALTVTDFELKILKREFNLNNDREKLAYVNQAVKEIARENDPVAQDLYINKLARQTQLTEDALKVKLMQQRRLSHRVKRNIQQLRPQQSPGSEKSANNLEYDQVQIRLLYLFIHFPEAQRIILEDHFLFPDADFAQLADLWLQFSAREEKPEIKSFLDFIPDRLQGIIVSAEMAKMPQDFSKREIEEQINFLQQKQRDSELNSLRQKILEAARVKDEDQLIRLTQRVLKLKRNQG